MAAKSGKDTEAAPEKEAGASAGGYQLEYFTPIDNDECLITIKDIVDDPIWGTSINIALENKSADKTYMFSANDIIINGVQCDGYFAKEVAPGKKANDSISLKFSDSGLTENGITEYTDIEDAAVNGSWQIPISPGPFAQAPADSRLPAGWTARWRRITLQRLKKSSLLSGHMTIMTGWAMILPGRRSF